ncbi:MAG: hypothetical protein GXW85_03095 [Clostridia bacterium]|nr:hypothetical protein [Clostridia bacterium]
MAKELIMENECAILWYHTDSKIVHHQIKKYAYGKNLQELLMKGTELLRTKRATKWLSDDRNSSALTKADMEWGDSVWFPEAVKSGWKYWAIVQPEKVIGQINMKNLIEQYAKHGITAKMFTDPDEALEWLKAQ